MALFKDEIIKLFKDKDLEHEIFELDLGIVNAGESRKYTVWMQNNSLAHLKEIIIDINHNEVKVTEAPMEMTPHTVEEVTIEWSPSITLKEGLTAQLNITAKEIYG